MDGVNSIWSDRVRQVLELPEIIQDVFGMLPLMFHSMPWSVDVNLIKKFSFKKLK